MSAKRNDSRGLLSKDGAAEFLGVSRRTIDRLVSGGFLPRVKILGSSRYRIMDLEKIAMEGAEL